MKCEGCSYYGVPADAYEGTESDCMFVPDEDTPYPICSILYSYFSKIKNIFDCFVEHGTENEKALEYVRCWVHCEWLAGCIDEYEYQELQCAIDEAYTEYYLWS